MENENNENKKLVLVNENNENDSGLFSVNYNVWRIFHGLGGLCFQKEIDIHKAIEQDDIRLMYRYFVLEKKPIDGFESLSSKFLNDGSLIISNTAKLTFLDDHVHYCSMCQNEFKIDEMAVVIKSKVCHQECYEELKKKFITLN